MPTELRRRIHTPYAEKLDLPPAFKEVPLREAGDAFAHACAIAPKEGAGTLVWVRRFDIVELALVLEPDEPLANARRIHYVGMCALFDTLVSHAPPEKLLQFVWPDVVTVDGGLIAGAQLGWPKGADEKTPPAWMVFATMIRTAVIGMDEPGKRPDIVALEEEGFDELGSGRMVETFARHFMVWADAFQQDGFRPVAEHYLQHLPSEESVERSIDGTGDLLTRRKGKLDTTKQRLVPALAKLDWYDPVERGLKL